MGKIKAVKKDRLQKNLSVDVAIYGLDSGATESLKYRFLPGAKKRLPRRLIEVGKAGDQSQHLLSEMPLGNKSCSTT